MTKSFVMGVALWLGLQGSAQAMTIEEQVVSSLVSQGYVIVEEGYTFLGRLRIVATNGEIRRELVVNPGTGEILRDYAVFLQHVANAGPANSRSKSNSPEPLSGAARPSLAAGGGSNSSGPTDMLVGSADPVETNPASADPLSRDTEPSAEDGMVGVILDDMVLPVDASQK